MPSFHINRSRTLKALLEEQGWHAAGKNEIADFAMWTPEQGDERKAVCDVLDRQTIYKLDYKLSMFEILKNAGFEHLTPQTFSVLPDYLSYLKTTGETVDCFLKSNHGTNGEDVFYFNGMRPLMQKLISIREMHGTAIIQSAVKNPLLIDNKKFKVRIYVLLLKDWTTFVFSEGLIVRHLKDFDPGSMHPDVHLSPNAGDTTELLSESGLESKLGQKLRDTIVATVKSLQISLGSADPISGTYQLMGYDFVVNSGFTPFLIEINGFPNFERRDPAGMSLSNQLMRDMIGMVINPEILGKNRESGHFVPVL